MELFTQIDKFQFHKGTIRTRRNTESGGNQANFNSIKVRLEHHLQEHQHQETRISIP